MTTDRPGQVLGADSTIGAWLDDPRGAEVIRGVLAASGMTEASLPALRDVSLARLMKQSGRVLPDGAIDGLVAKVNDGRLPAPEEVIGREWQERVVPGRFTGRTVIVTGAGSGIGRATASRIVREGGRVVAADVIAERVQSLEAEAGAAGPEGAGVVAVVSDLADPDGVAAIVTAAGERIDGLANVAGIPDDFSPVHETTDEMWRRVFAVNVDGVFRLTRAVLPSMLAAGRGSIVNVASEAALRGSSAGAAYTAAKHAVVGLTRNCAFMYEPHGIRVNAVAPGGVLTNIVSPGAAWSEFGSGRIGTVGATPPIAVPEALAASITFLLSDDGVNVSGAVLPSDGGQSVH